MGTFRYIGDAALIGRGRNALADAVNEAAEDLVGKAQDATPVDTGTLKASIHVSQSASAGNPEARVETGGEANEYALYVHEGTSRGVPAFKYLEGPLIDNRATYVAFIRRAAAGAY